MQRLVCLVLCVFLISTPATALAWSTTAAEEFDTHDWLAHQSARMTADAGYGWVDIAKMVGGSDSVDASAGPDVACDVSTASNQHTATQVASLVEQMVAAYEAGDFDSGSTLAGHLSHVVADLGDPVLAAGWSATGDSAQQWRREALALTDEAFEHNGWIAARELVYVEDPEQWVSDLQARASVDAAAVASIVLSDGSKSVSFRRVLARRLEDVVFCTASLLATVRVRAESSPSTLRRLAGATRYETAVAMARETHPTGASSVVLVNGEAWADGITATSLCALLDAPVLFTGSSGLPEATLRELDRLAPESVTIVGGTGVVSEQVAEILRQRGYSVQRLGGVDRYATSALVAAHARTLDQGGSGSAFVCTGAGYADALSIAQITGRTGEVVILARPGADPR